MRASDTVLRHIEEQLEEGALVVGMRLPGERALAEQLGVSRGSVREALQVLGAMGVVRRAVGSGDGSGAVLVADPSLAFDSAVRLHVATRAFPVAQIVETRVLLESWAVAAAARGDGSVDGVLPLLDRMDEPDIQLDEFLQLDARLHVELAVLSGNAVVAQMMASLRGSIESYVLRSIPNVDDWSELLTKLRAEHRAVVAAIAARDPHTAEIAVTRHIREFYERSGLEG
ncbi:FCD domain-containing protein [Nocardioides zeae]|uniref:FCD domain-containing protein n=1 Tax=Nocardioides imazamoxiresistens TaxID=3231893 RepID=A0ABU3PXX1_9ACTN|nr:FCD domain-containing protein [Nocardioides zeae]MDT9594080.1 FCD domain-containing protein [Nocardioides zeae]